MATWQGTNGGLLAGIGGVNSNAPSVNDIGNTLQLIRQNNDIDRSGANNVGLTALQGLSGIAGVFQQEKQAQRQKEFQQAYANAYASGDRGALRQLATQYPDQIESVRKGMGFIDEDQRNSIGTLAAGARLASSSPEAMQSWLQNNAKELTRVGVDPNSVAQMYQQNPSGFGEFVDHLGMAALGPIDYFNVQDKMAGREIDRGRLAETIRSNQAGEALQARGQNLSYQSAMTGHNIAAQRLALDQQEFGFKMQQAQEKAQQLISEAPKLSVNMEKGIETAVNNATASSNSANSMSALAQQFRAENQRQVCSVTHRTCSQNLPEAIQHCVICAFAKMPLLTVRFLNSYLPAQQRIKTLRSFDRVRQLTWITLRRSQDGLMQWQTLSDETRSLMSLKPSG